MLTFFTTAKPFKGLTGVIQENALRSWARLAPQPEILLFGPAEGADKVVAELGIKHILDVKCTESGLPYLNEMFTQADALATNPLLCFSNANILFPTGLMEAVRQVANHKQLFLLTGNSWTADVRESISFSLGWENQIRLKAIPPRDNARGHWGYDYFVFPRYAFADFPALIVGRPGWDNWFLYHARRRGGLLIDATEVVGSTHQDHYFEFTNRSMNEVYHGKDGQTNRELIGGTEYLFSAMDATHILKKSGLEPAHDFPHFIRRLVTFPLLHERYRFLRPTVGAILRVTLPLRKPLGLTRAAMAKSAYQIRPSVVRSGWAPARNSRQVEDGLLTIFCTAKPFLGRIGTMQRNAIRSWQQLQPAPEIILFGDSAGTAAAAEELGIRHIPRVRCSPTGLPYLSDMFAQADSLATNPFLCYIDADILLLSDIMTAVRQAATWDGFFLLTGCSHTIEQEGTLNFNDGGWERDVMLRSVSPSKNKRNAWGLDYFLFRRGDFAQFPPFIVGRPGWDNWFLYHVRSKGGRVIDATQVATAVHQEHHFEFTEKSQAEIWQGEDGQANLKLVGGTDHLFSALDITHVVTPDGLRPATSYLSLWRRLYTFPILHPNYRFMRPALEIPLAVTRPLRSRIGITAAGLASPRQAKN